MAGPADLARELLGLADDDLVAARALLDVPGVTDAIVGFHAQQAAEKALKAALASADLEFPYTHNITTLMQLCDDAELTLPNELATVDLLTPYGVAGRYGARSPATVDRATALELAERAVSWSRAVVAP
jgi:HEPN domain-containing protein